MKRKNTTRNALVMSILSMLLCVSMLVGTTFAWFTDEVVTGMNTIAAGNLDIELLADGNAVNEATPLFDDVQLWEPGVVVYENLQVANVGTLALKYQMTLNIGNENNLNGHKLSEVLKVAIIDKIEAGATREEVLAAAEAANAAAMKDGRLSNFYLAGELEAGETADEQAIVIYWTPNDNATDNLYNANNGQVTSDGEPLHIEFGINLQATQLMFEEDSFGDDYDKDADILPKATVNDMGAQTVWATQGIGGAASEYTLPFSLQFLPNETVEEAQASPYRYWHADFVVKADRDVPANSIALLGYYDAWCQYNNDNWVAMESDQAIAANTEVRLVSALGATVNYEEICTYAIDPANAINGFLCSAADLTGENAGTTITVELRMYEVPAQGECANGGGCKHPSIDCETDSDNYVIIGTYTYTFPAEKAASQAELDAAAAIGGEIELAAGNYTMPLVNLQGKTLVISGTKDTVIDVSNVDARNQFVIGATLMFDGVTLNFGTANYMGFANTESLTYKNCDINGLQFLFGENVTFEKCNLNSNGAEHCVWTYGAQNVSFVDCEFTYGDRCVNCYSDNDVVGGKQTVNFTNCNFKTENTASEGAVEINSVFFSVGIEVNLEGCTAPAYGQMAYVSPWDSGNGAKTTINIK